MIWIFHGPIASGKSTMAAELAEYGALVANDDSIVQCVHGGLYGCYDKAYKPLYKGIRNSIITYAAAMDLDVVVDSTALTRQTRQGILSLGRSLDMKVGLMLFRNGIFQGAPDGIRRFEADPRGHTKEYWMAVGESHKLNVEPITPEEAQLYDDINTVGWYA